MLKLFFKNNEELFNCIEEIFNYIKEILYRKEEIFNPNKNTFRKKFLIILNKFSVSYIENIFNHI